jgi:hypothetical protein
MFFYKGCETVSHIEDFSVLSELLVEAEYYELEGLREIIMLRMEKLHM